MRILLHSIDNKGYYYNLERKRVEIVFNDGVERLFCGKLSLVNIDTLIINVAKYVPESNLSSEIYMGALEALKKYREMLSEIEKLELLI